MATPQVCGLVALAASGKERFTQSDAIAIIDRFGKAGDITFDVNPTGANSYSLYFDANGSSAYIVTGQDRVTTHSSASNPPIVIREGDSIDLVQPTPNAFCTLDGVSAVPNAATYNITTTSPTFSYYTLNGTDRNGAVSGNDVTVTVNEGDTINFNLSNVDTVHPFFVRNAAGNVNVSGATNQGGTGNVTVSWTPSTAGTYSYICGNHSSMKGTITVLSASPDHYRLTVGDRVLDGSQGSQDDPTINIEQGDALDIELMVDLSAHPIYIRDSNNNNVANVTGQGQTQAFLTIGWSRQNCPAAGTYKYVCDNHANMSGNIVVHPQGTYYNHPLYLQTATGTGGVNLLSGVTGQGAYSHGTVSWTAPIGSAGTYYYQCGFHSAMYGEVIVQATQGVLGQAGNHDDDSCQKGSPNLEIFANNPRESTGYIAGWYREVLKGSRRTKPWDQGDRQIFPRTNTYFRP